ncbi:MAG: GNAT family N-acetyltransferase [Spirosomataceae bacterium]
MELSFITKQGAAFESVFDQLAALRIRVFRDYPYLYEGTVEHEREYLKVYAKAEQSFLFGVMDGQQLVGATTAIPLANETPDVQEPFLKAGMDIERIFYFGESILLSAYRGLGLGNRFFDEREAHARRLGHYTHTCFCGVVRPADHPAKPHDYRPLDEFWTKRGYLRQPQLQSQFEWLDLGDSTPTIKPMVYWMRPL